MASRMAAKAQSGLTKSYYSGSDGWFMGINLHHDASPDDTRRAFSWNVAGWLQYQIESSHETTSRSSAGRHHHRKQKLGTLAVP